jgi:hypothetical protein
MEGQDWGFAIVKQLIEAQGGSISKSELSKVQHLVLPCLWKTNVKPEQKAEILQGFRN